MNLRDRITIEQLQEKLLLLERRLAALEALFSLLGMAPTAPVGGDA